MPVSNGDRSVRPVYVPWEKRAKSIEAMPGGVTNYFESLRWTAQMVREEPIAPEVLAARMMHQYATGGENVRLALRFLKMVGFLRVESHGCNLPDVMQSWLRDGDSTPLMVILHHKVRLIGEMLAAVDDPMKTSELHHWANDRYRTGWKTTGQIAIRVAWLRSAGLMRRDNLRLYRTDAGSAFLDLVVVEPPFDGADVLPHLAVPAPLTPGREREPQHADPLPDPESAKQSGPVDELADRIVGASTDTRNPGQFESVVCEAFNFLGFDAEHLGGSGDTDVLIDARLGRGTSYRVTIDAKTTSAPALQDQQVDWVTLSEHRSKHGADYSMLVGPNPSTRRLLERARSQGVAVLSAEALAGLCRSHAARPLGLADYKSMFQYGGTADLAHIEQQSDQAGKLAALAGRLLDAIGEDAERFGPVIARDLHRGLARDEGNIVATEAEIQGLLDTLASPLVGAIQGDPDSGYVLACSPTVTAERLRILGGALSAG